MNLLPIIYASLLIFGSLFLIVLITSYISYKVKQHNNIALATVNSRSISHKGHFSNEISSDKLNIIRKASLKDRESEDTDIAQSVNNDYRSVQSRPVDRNYSQTRNIQEVRNQRIVRMTRVQNIRSNNNFSKPSREKIIVPYQTKQYSAKSNILRYYEDF